MISADLIAVLGTVAFVGLFIGSSMLAGGGFGLEKRASLLERRDPGTAAALRRAQYMSDFPGGGVFGDEAFSSVCTPSRRTWHDGARVRATDSDLRVEVPEEALPPMPATVVALGHGEHMPQAPRPRHPIRRSQPADTAKSSGHQPTASG
jgi:hypothetical protein